MPRSAPYEKSKFLGSGVLKNVVKFLSQVAHEYALGSRASRHFTVGYRSKYLVNEPYDVFLALK